MSIRVDHHDVPCGRLHPKAYVWHRRKAPGQDQRYSPKHYKGNQSPHGKSKALDRVQGDRPQSCTSSYNENPNTSDNASSSNMTTPPKNITPHFFPRFRSRSASPTNTAPPPP